MPTARSSFAASPTLVAVCAWLIPGSGYFLLGERVRGIIVGVTIFALFLAGIVVGGIRIMDPPGWNSDDQQQSIISTFVDSPVGQLSDKPWYVGQILCGPVTVAASAVSIHLAEGGVPSSHSRSWEIGALYTAVAGMLNLLVIIDSAYRASVFKSQG
jgi:hypothetical protein